MPYSRNVSEAYSTPYGAIWKGVDDGAVEFTNDTIYTNAPFVATAGKYVVCQTNETPYPNAGYSIMLKDMLTRDTIHVGDVSGINHSVPPIVAENGLVVYGEADTSAIMKYQQGITPSSGTRITTLDSEFDDYIYPVTDGKNVLFTLRKGTDVFPVTVPYLILWHHGISTDTLSVIAGRDQFTPPPIPNFYAVANGFIAYVKQDNADHEQVWLRDTTGISRQLTNFSGNSYINALNENGDIIYTTPDGAYYLKYGRDSARAIGYHYGNLFYRDSSWYVINGRTLYKLNVDAFRTVANGNWTDAASWENGNVPPQNADVIVTTNIVVNTNVVCNSLKLHLREALL